MGVAISVDNFGCGTKKMHAGGGEGGDRKQLYYKSWPNNGKVSLRCWALKFCIAFYYTN